MLERLPNGEYAWLKPETVSDPEPDDALYTITDAGRDYLRRLRALEACFGPWPTVAETCRP